MGCNTVFLCKTSGIFSIMLHVALTFHWLGEGGGGGMETHGNWTHEDRVVRVQRERMTLREREREREIWGEEVTLQWQRRRTQRKEHWREINEMYSGKREIFACHGRRRMDDRGMDMVMERQEWVWDKAMGHQEERKRATPTSLKGSIRLSQYQIIGSEFWNSFLLVC